MMFPIFSNTLLYWILPKTSRLEGPSCIHGPSNSMHWFATIFSFMSHKKDIPRVVHAFPHPMPQELPEISKQCLVLEPVNIHAASGWRRFLLGFTLAESRKLFWCKNAGGFGRFLCMNNLQNVDLHLSESIRSISRLEATTWMWSSAKHTKLGTVKGQSRSDFLVLLPYCWAKLFKGS